MSAVLSQSGPQPLSAPSYVRHRRLLAWVADANPHKQGKFLPGSRIPIVDPARIAVEKPDYVLVLPWNLLHEVRQQQEQIKTWGGQFVVAVPQLGFS